MSKIKAVPCTDMFSIPKVMDDWQSKGYKFHSAVSANGENNKGIVIFFEEPQHGD